MTTWKNHSNFIQTTRISRDETLSHLISGDEAAPRLYKGRSTLQCLNFPWLPRSYRGSNISLFVGCVLTDIFALEQKY